MYHNDFKFIYKILDSNELGRFVILSSKYNFISFFSFNEKINNK